jgi:membrane protease YdiL (CAAX protease family)
MDRFKPLCSLLLIVAGAPLLAALVSPWVYQWLQSFAEEGSVLDAPFFRVTSRIVLVMVAALLAPAYRLSGLKGRAVWGLAPAPNRNRQFWIGIGLGVGSMLLIYFLGTALGVFAWDTRGKSGFYIARKILQIIFGGLFIGIFEEILFRGYIQNALKKSLGIVATVLIGSFFFSIVHFMRPIDPNVVGEWYSGFLLFKHLFARAGASFIQEAGTLFCMGTVLALLSHWMKTVYVAMGLHVGWVWVMMFFRLFTENQRNMIWLFGDNDWVSKAWIGPMMALTVLLVVLATKKKWVALGSVK